MASSLRIDSGPTFTFLTVLTSEGIPLNSPRLVEEALEAAGANGRRYRTVHLQYPVLAIRTLAEAATFDAAETLARNYLVARIASQIGTLTIDAGGTLYTFRNVHVAACDPVPWPGQVSGPGAGSSSLGHVRCAWAIELTGG